MNPAIVALGKSVWKPALGLVIVGAGVWAFVSWRDNLVEAAEKRGFSDAERQYASAVAAANRVIDADNKTLNLMSVMFDSLAEARSRQIDLTIKPHLEGIQNEVASDSRYRDCTVSAGVLDHINAARAVADASVSASNPKED